jgi:hypothetical protein
MRTTAFGDDGNQGSAETSADIFAEHASSIGAIVLRTQATVQLMKANV